MSPVDPLYESVQGVSLFDLKSFLKSKGWKEAFHTNKKLTVFHGPRSDSGVPLEIFLPSTDTYSDLRHRMHDAFMLLSNLYELEPSRLHDLLSCLNHDKFLVRVAPNDHSLNSIPLELAKKEVTGLRNLFLYSACSEQQAIPHHEQPLPLGYKITKKCRFGHTFHGSFGFSVESPIMEESKQLDLFSPPLERRVVERIVRGILNINKAIHEDNPDIIVDNFKTGLNSRMCEALIDMKEELETPVELSVRWASVLPPSNDTSDFKPSLIGDNEISYLKYAAEKLKEVSPERTIIIGMVVNLHSNDPISTDGKRSIILKYQHEGYGSIDVKIELGVDQYRQAIEAHKSKALLEVKGLLERKGTVWQLVAAIDLNIINDI